MSEPPADEPLTEPAPGRAAFVISQLFHYIGAVIGVGLLLGGLIALLFGVRTLVLPREFEQARDGLRTMLHALAFALPGAVALWWSLREARRGEQVRTPTVFWGRALYFYLVSLIALGFVLGGSVAMFSAGVDAAIPHCFPSECFPPPSEAARNAVDAAIFVVAAGPVLWWHLRQGRLAVGRR